VEGASAHHFSTNFKKALPPNSAQLIRIAQEMAALSTSLPLDIGSAIFIRTVSHVCLDCLMTRDLKIPSRLTCQQRKLLAAPLKNVSKIKILSLIQIIGCSCICV